MATQGLKNSYVTLALALFVAARLIAHFSYVVYDDAFISYRYSLNLANGYGLIYNLDENILGTTTPLFAILLSVPAFLGLALPSFTPILNIVIDTCLCLLIIKHVLRDNSTAALLFVAIYAISPIAGRITVGGMEANLFALMSLGSLVLYQAGNFYQGACLAAISYFVRPEGVIMVALQCLHRLIVGRKVASAFSMGALALALALAGMGLMYLVYGNPFPQSVVAKSGDYDPLTVVLKGLLMPEPVSMLLVLPAVLGAVIGFRHASPVRLLLIWGLSYLALYMIASPKIWSWYALPVQITLFVSAALGGAFLLARLPLLRRIPTKALSSAAAVAMIAAPAAVLIIRGPDRVTANIYEPLANFCDQRTATELSIYAGDIGIVGYACYPAKILDGAGLVWPDRFLHADTDDIIKAYQPEFLFLVSSKPSAGQALDNLGSENYRPLRRFNSGGDIDIPRTDQMPDSWRQDYVMFERY